MLYNESAIDVGDPTAISDHSKSFGQYNATRVARPTPSDRSDNSVIRGSVGASDSFLRSSSPLLVIHVSRASSTVVASREAAADHRRMEENTRSRDTVSCEGRTCYKCGQESVGAVSLTLMNNDIIDAITAMCAL